jgi:hypothetical protein
MWMSDPCVKVSGLMQIRSDLEQITPGDNTEQVTLINQLLKDHLGISDQNSVYRNFVQSRQLAKTRGRITPALPTLFTLVCDLGHRRQYTITCP